VSSTSPRRDELSTCYAYVVDRGSTGFRLAAGRSHGTSPRYSVPVGSKGRLVRELLAGGREQQSWSRELDTENVISTSWSGDSGRRCRPGTTAMVRLPTKRSAIG